ncbi:hypothetical protein SLE2022_351380 [Rubroshorea leprosula]
MPTPVSVARQCLTDEAARALDEAVAVARRRSHAQTSSLHAVSALLALPSSTLRDACARARGSGYPSRLQFRALDLCVGVSLDRLPSSKTIEDPPISNSLMAAIKRSQANQRRHPDNYHFQQLHNSNNSNNPTAALLKVELKYFILSILDDPIVSRVFGEAGFRSCDIKLALLQPPMTQVSPRFPLARRPPIFLCNLTDTDPSLSPGRLGFAFPFSDPADDIDENCRRIGEVMIRKGGKNPLLVGVYAKDALRSFCESIQRGKTGFLPEDLSGLNMVSIEKDVSEYVVGGSEERIGLKFKELEHCSGVGVVLNFGDLKWLIDDDVSTDAVSSLVSKLTVLLEMNRGKLWLMGAAGTYEMYSNFLARFPSVEKDWDLHLLPITTSKSSSERASSKSSLMGSFVPFGGFFTATDFKNPLSSKNQSMPRCCLCNEKYEQEVASILKEGSTVSVADQHSENLPTWLRMTALDKNKGVDEAKTEDDRAMANAKVLGLQRKWNDICQRLHHSQPFPSLDIPQVQVPIAECFRHVVDEKQNDGEDKIVDGSQFANIVPGVPMNLQESLPPKYNAQIPMASETHNVNFQSRMVVKAPKPQLIGKEGPWLGHHPHHILSPPSDLTSALSGPSVTTDLKLGTHHASTSQEPRTTKLQDHEELLRRVSGSISAEFDANSDNSSHQFAQSSSCSGLTSAERYYPRDYKSIVTALAEKVGWQDEVIRAVSKAVSRCITGDGKHYCSNPEGAIWLTFLGPDRVGKRRIASTVAEILYGSQEHLISVNLSSGCKASQSNAMFECEELNGYDMEFRGKTIADYIAAELSKKPYAIIFLENVDKADCLVQKSLSQGIRTGKFLNAHGREISIKNPVFITTSSVAKGNSDVVWEKKSIAFSEERILGAKRWQMQILVACGSEDTRRGTDISVRVTRGKETLNAASVKRKLIDVSDSTEQEKSNNSQRAHKALRSPLDLNLPVEETEEDINSTDYDSDSISENTEAWLEEFFDQVHQKIVFKPFDFDALADKIVKDVSSQLQNLEVVLEIDEEVMVQILGAAWLSDTRKSLEEWIEKVLCRTVVEAQKKYQLTPQSVLKLVACYGISVEEEAPGVRLPAKINLN